MLLFTDIELSVLQKATDLFTSPPAGTLTSAWNVYLEDKFMDTTFTPTPPFIFILDKRVRPHQSRLPMLISERAPTAHNYFEIGNEAGHLFTFNWHVFARNRGERGALAAFLETNLARLSLYDFSGSTPAFVETATVINRASVQVNQVPDVGLEGALNNMESVVFDFLSTR